MDLPKGIRRRGRRLEIRIQHNNKPYYIYTTPSKNPDSKDAITEALRIQEDYKARLTLGLPVSHLQDDDGRYSVLFEEAAQRYLEDLAVEYSTIKNYAGMINRYWTPAFAGQLVCEIKSKAVNRTVKRLNVSRKTQRNALGVLKGIFNWAIEEEYAHVNPCIGIRIQKHQKPPADPFNPSEKTAILKAIQKRYGANDQKFVYYSVLLETGMRPSEVLALNWPDYDGEHFYVTKALVCGRQKPSTKNNERRRVYLKPELRKIINNHATRFEGTFIFKNIHGGPFLNNSRLDEHWRRILTTAKVRYRRPYNCRHTYASIGLSSGLQPGFLAKQLGHTLEVFYRTYADWIEDDRYEAECRKLDAIKPASDNGEK